MTKKFGPRSKNDQRRLYLPTRELKNEFMTHVQRNLEHFGSALTQTREGSQAYQQAMCEWRLHADDQMAGWRRHADELLDNVSSEVNDGLGNMDTLKHMLDCIMVRHVVPMRRRQRALMLAVAALAVPVVMTIVNVELLALQLRGHWHHTPPEDSDNNFTQ